MSGEKVGKKPGEGDVEVDKGGHIHEISTGK
jgi:hypothetical protein